MACERLTADGNLPASWRGIGHSLNFVGIVPRLHLPWYGLQEGRGGLDKGEKEYQTHFTCSIIVSRPQGPKVLRGIVRKRNRERQRGVKDAGKCAIRQGASADSKVPCALLFDSLPCSPMMEPTIRRAPMLFPKTTVPLPIVGKLDPHFQGQGSNQKFIKTRCHFVISLH